MTQCTNNEEGRQEMTQENKQAASTEGVYDALKATLEKLVPRPNTCPWTRDCRRPCAVSLAYVTFTISDGGSGSASEIAYQVRWLQELIGCLQRSGVKIRAPLHPDVGPVVSPFETSTENGRTEQKFRVNLGLALYAGHHVVVDDMRVYREVVRLRDSVYICDNPLIYFAALTRNVFEHRANWPGAGDVRESARAVEIEYSKCYLESQCLGGYYKAPPAPPAPLPTEKETDLSGFGML